ncbi:MAG: glutamate cyclase domain-containing protein [Chloroflexota bacterium]|nr:glutamate cyclase domain-containing protein [Chloroflexota bacterium]
MGIPEDIILQKDIRNISKLKRYLGENFLTDAANEVVARKGVVLIVTGFYISYANASETDGPAGSIALGRALKNIGFNVIYVTDKWSYSILEGITESKDRIVEFPVDNHENSKKFASKLIEELDPSLCISIERASLMGDGTYRNWKGEDVSEYNAKLDYLFNYSKFSIGIGDGGNEIGMGNLNSEIKKVEGLPDNPATTKVNNLIISSCSNWGAYGLIAEISSILNKNLLISVDDAKELIIKSVDLGAVEGMSGDSSYAVDGRNLEEDSVCLSQLHDYLRKI